MCGVASQQDKNTTADGYGKSNKRLSTSLNLFVVDEVSVFSQDSGKHFGLEIL